MNSKIEKKPTWIEVECPHKDSMDFPTCVLFGDYIIAYAEQEESDEDEDEDESDSASGSESEPEPEEESSEEEEDELEEIVRRRRIRPVVPKKEEKKVTGDFPDVMVFDIRTYQWEKVEFSGDRPRTRVCNSMCRYQEDKIIFYGGECNAHVSNEVFVWTVDITKGMVIRSEKKNMKKDALRRHNHCAEIFENIMYIFGGIENLAESGQPLNELWALNLDSFQWTRCKDFGDIPAPRLRHRSVLHGSNMYVFGGRTNTEPYTRFNDLRCLDLRTMNWKLVDCSGEVPSPRNGMSLVENNGVLYVFGGVQGSGDFLSDVYKIDLEGNKNWKMVRVKNKGPSNRGNQAAVAYKNGIFIFGGSNESQLRFHNFYYLNLYSTGKNEERSSKSQYVDQISHCFLDKKYADVSFVVEGESFPAHKIILTNRCNYFVNVFASGMQESKQDEIQIPDCKARTFKAFLEYVYCNEVKLENEFALDLFILANKWRYVELEGICEQYLANNISIKNVLEVSSVANSLEIGKLINCVIDFVIKNTDELKASGDLYKIDHSILVDVMLKLGENVKSKKK